MRIDRHLVRTDQPSVVLPEEYKQAISRALGFTGVLKPLRAEDITGQREVLPRAGWNGQHSDSVVDLEVPPE